MPLIQGEDKKGYYIKWGEHGHHYYFRTYSGKNRAIKSALKQAKAIYYNQNK